MTDINNITFTEFSQQMNVSSGQASRILNAIKRGEFVGNHRAYVVLRHKFGIDLNELIAPKL